MKRKTNIRGFIRRNAATTLLISIALVALSFSGKGASSLGQGKTLGFAERVAYQRAIEEVYWRHRIWPKEGPDPKPSLNDVMSQAQLEKKVADYLRKSQALEDYWQRPLSGEQLQAEMDRMAQHSKQPEVLRELFEALGNDQFVIAECLARPALAERLLTNWYAYDQRIHGELKQRAQADLLAHPAVEQMNSGAYSEIELIKSDSGDVGQERDAKTIRLNSGEWDESVQSLAGTFNNTDAAQSAGFELQRSRFVGNFQSGATSVHSKNATSDYDSLPVGKASALQENETCYYATTVLAKTNDRLKLGTVEWLKEPLESWMAGAENEAPNAITVPNGNYTLPGTPGVMGGCTDDTWTPTSAPPDGRVGHTAVWTGSEMIVWGGFQPANLFGPAFNTGARYDPSTDNWTTTSLAHAPAGRNEHTAVWTGSEMIVWGGNDLHNILKTGGRYNPGTDSWTATSNTNAPSPRSGHTAVWTGNQMIIWGGSPNLNTGGRYNPNTNSWTATSTTNAPAGRYGHTAVWTGNQMIVWGGVETSSSSNTGGRYNPMTNSWTATSTINAPDARQNHTAVWSGAAMIIWGGDSGGSSFRTGGKYFPGTNTWVATTMTNAPQGRSFFTAVWTGHEMIIWGGFGGSGYLGTGGRYNPGANSWTATSTTNAPTGRDAHTAVWSGTEMIVWGGQNSGLSNDGGRYNPTSNSWVPTGKTPTRRRYHVAVWTGSEMIIWGGIANIVGASYTNTGGKYDPSTDSWTATTTIQAPTGREFPTAVWTGSEMIVWGGFSFDGAEHFWNTGGRYNPSTDRWLPTSTTNAPDGRELHTAVWTGSAMIVWGGLDVLNNLSHDLNTGGVYNPGTDSWTATSTAHAPGARDSHVAVWTGSEMIIWGGGNDTSGGRFNPNTNSWIATSTTNAPVSRSGAKAVWTGSEMIVWGGTAFVGPGFIYFDTGGRYNPNTNSWTTTSTTNAPTARSGHTAVWTGSEMIVWGGHGDFDLLGYYFNTGGRYDPGTNSWTATSTVNAPEGRYRQTAVWTGNEMIIWGGILYSNTSTNTGGRYCSPGPPAQLGNISTRAFVQTGDNVMIGGFIVQGTGPKRVIIRAIGPELGAPPYNIPNALANPTLELHNADGVLIGSNDDWQHTIIGGVIIRNQIDDIQNSGHAPANLFESAIIADLPPGNYTAIVSGVNNTSGVGLVEVYDLGANTASILGNISTRSFVQTGDNVMIGGFIVQGTGAKRVIVRAIGPELGAPPYNIPNALANPTLELHNGTGGLIASNDNWRTTIIGGIITGNQGRDIINSGYAPSDRRESAIIADLQPGNYTAILRGVNDTTGVGLVEVYDLH
jgi:N-acetylneuraminic acid mutarotase